jgi:SAM-dependent methyltransferase
MEEIPCIFCNKRIDNVAIVENGYTGLKCYECSLIFISPRPDAEEVIETYADTHAASDADTQFQFDKVQRLGAALTISRIKKYRQGGSVLELGPGGGFFLEAAKKEGYEPFGIELNPIEARWIREGLHIPCENEPLSGESFGGKQFDIIYHRNVLSHLHDPIRTFRALDRALKSNGILVFETGNIADVSKKYYKFFYQFSYPDHLFFFGEKSLRLLLERTGFKCIRIFSEAIFLQMLLQKALWRFKNAVRDKHVIEGLKSQDLKGHSSAAPTVKRRLRVVYRYLSHYLIRLGVLLPRKGRPLKLLVFAEKQRSG